MRHHHTLFLLVASIALILPLRSDATQGSGRQAARIGEPGGVG